MAYNTGNPIGSTDARDLSDNAQDFDEAVNGPSSTWVDRLGNTRTSLRGQVGYTGTGSGGAIQSYTSGLVLSGYNVIILYSGEFYRPSASATLPYTTTATLPDVDSNLVSIGDANLRQDLANDALGSGAALVSMEGGPSVEVAVLDRVIRVTSIAAMEAYSAPVGYVFSLNDGGRSGVFDVVSGDFSTELAADTLNGIYVGLADNPTATTKAAKRRFVGSVKDSWYGALGGSTDDTAALNAALLNEYAELSFESYTISGTLNVNSKSVESKMSGFINATTENSYIDIISTRCELKGIKLSGEEVATRGFYSETCNDFKLLDCSVKDILTDADVSKGWGVHTAFDGVTAYGLIENITVDDCPKGIRCEGHVVAEVPYGEVKLINATMTGTTGSDSNIYMLIDLDTASVIGGTFNGHPDTGPNIYRTKNGIITGGVYKGMSRGPTVGKNTTHFAITGNSISNMGFSGISCDLRDDADTPPDGRYPRGYGTVSGNTITDVYRPMYIQGRNMAITGNQISNFTGFLRFNGADNVLLSDNKFTNGPATSVIDIGDSSIVTIGKNFFDRTATDSLAYRVSDSTSYYEFKEVKYVTTTNVDIPNNTEVIFADATAGAITVRLPANVYLKARGKEITVIKLDSSTNEITIAVEGGQGTIVGPDKIPLQGGSVTYITSDYDSTVWLSKSSHNPLRNQVNSTAADLGALKDDFNELLEELRFVGLMK
jgi:hypothetical protein